MLILRATGSFHKNDLQAPLMQGLQMMAMPNLTCDCGGKLQINMQVLQGSCTLMQGSEV